MKQYQTRFWAFFLALSLSLSLAACSGGGKNTAATMHLRRTEGTVSVSDGDGKSVLPLNNIGLYSGYGVGTGTASYAWIDLDDVKLTKLDQNSEIAIQKEGKTLDIALKSGSLFFNVTEPLADDETMNIRTSTMLVGIRGTSGWVEARDGLSRVYLVEGKVECSAEGQTVRVRAGEMAELTADGELVVEPFAAEELPAFVWDELDNGAGEAPGPGETEAPKTGSEERQTNYEPDNADDFLEALRNAQDGDVITLAGDIEAVLTDDVKMYGGTEDDPVILDLNGHTLALQKYYISGSTSRVHHLYPYGALRILDSSAGGGTLNLDHFIDLRGSAHLFLDGGTINGSISASDGTFIMNGGTINGSVSAAGGSTFIMNGGMLNGDRSYADDYGYGSAVNVFADSQFIMNGGDIISAGAVGAVYCIGESIELNGGTITNSYDSTYMSKEWYGSALNVKSPETVIKSFEPAVLRSKKGVFIGYSASVNDSAWETWWPDGYISTEAPDAEGYYYLVKE